MENRKITINENELKGLIIESINKALKKRGMIREFKNNQHYTHFAVNKQTNKIVNGWDYRGYDPSELRQFSKDYFYNDLVDNDMNPKDYKILTDKFLRRMDIDPDDNNNWAQY